MTGNGMNKQSLKKSPCGSYLHYSLSTHSKVLKAGKIVILGSLTKYFWHLKLLYGSCSSSNFYPVLVNYPITMIIS